MHPRTPELIGMNRLDYRDLNGFPHVQHLIARGREGGGFVRYVIGKPSSGKPALKLTYVMPLPEWGWLLCTGIYLEDVEYVLKKVDTQVTGNNRATMRWIGSLAFLGMAAIIFFGLMLNIRGRREAKETERVRLSSELHDGICQRLAAARMQASAGLIHLAVIPSAYVPAQAAFRNLEKDLKDVLQETREISHGLHPMILKDLGLAAALRQLAQDMENDTTSIQFRRRGLVEGLSDGKALPSIASPRNA